MIIEDLVRTGRYLREGGLPPEQLLLLISDVNSSQVRNFFQHIFVVELSPNGDGDAKSLAMQVWGQEIQPDRAKKKTVFQPDLGKAVAAPFVFPGGNPIHPQGVYGVPAFPVFEKHLSAFINSAKSVADFLRGRLARCQSIKLDDSTVDLIATSLHHEVVKSNPLRSSKPLGLVLLVDASTESSPYQYVSDETERTIGHSLFLDNKFISPRSDIVLELYSKSKVEEGRQSGTRTGCCTICGGESDAGMVSIYCKSWPWFLPTWTCPIPHGGKGDIAEGVALDEPCYEALNIGASYFDKVTSPVDSIVTRELFSPVSDREGRRTIEHKSIGDLTTIYGSALLLPILEFAEINPEERREFGEGLRYRLNRNESSLNHITQVLGFEAAIPIDVEEEIYRLTLVYYSGDASRGDIHLRCIIEDVVPTVVHKLQQLARSTARNIPNLCREVMPGCSEKQQVWHANRFQYIPFLLARAYGGAFVWDQLQSVFRRVPLNIDRPTANIAHRISSLTRNFPNTQYDVREEVLFYLAFLDFVQTYNDTIAEGDLPPMAMRDWKDLLVVVTESPPEEMAFESATELGFACGAVVRQFSRQYWNVTKTGSEGKDYLRHRIIAFGSDLSPDAVWKKALPTMFNVELKLRDLRLADDFKRRIGVLLNRCDDAQEEIRSSRDGFMAAFWSGYSLQKTNKVKQDEQPVALGAIE